MDDAGNILIWKGGEIGGDTKLGSDGDEKDKVYLDGTPGVPQNGSCRGAIPSRIRISTFLCSSADVLDTR